MNHFFCLYFLNIILPFWFFSLLFFLTITKSLRKHKHCLFLWLYANCGTEPCPWLKLTYLEPVQWLLLIMKTYRKNIILSQEQLHYLVVCPHHPWLQCYPFEIQTSLEGFNFNQEARVFQWRIYRIHPYIPPRSKATQTGKLDQYYSVATLLFQSSRKAQGGNSLIQHQEFKWEIQNQHKPTCVGDIIDYEARFIEGAKLGGLW